MADPQYSVKKITDLTTNSSANDSDLYVLGNQGTATMRKITFSTIASAILNKLTSFTFNSLTTSSKNLPGAVNELNTNGLVYRGNSLTDANNANLSPGVYQIGAQGSVANIPSDFAWGVLIVYPHDYNTQMLVNSTRMYARDRTGSPPTWRPWNKVSFDDLDVKVGTFTPASGQSLSNGLLIRQSGHVVTIFGYINNVTISTTASTVIGAIGNVSLPANAVRVVGSVGANAYSMGTPSYFVIGTDGNLSVSTSATGSDRAVFFNATWIV